MEELFLTYFNKGRFRNEVEQEVKSRGVNWSKIKLLKSTICFFFKINFLILSLI